jgi:hypothetical protein
MKAKEVLIAVIAMCGFIGILGYAGTYEWAEEVCYSMPAEAYFTILDTLGEDATMKEIAREYMDNREYYDTLEEW